MPDLTLEQAVEIAQEALRGLREADKELGWELARRKLRVLGFLLDDEPEEDPRDSGELKCQ